MAEVNDLFRQIEVALPGLQQIQSRYDDAMWDIQDPPFAKIRHICIHLSILTGKFASAVESGDHAEHHGDSGIAPDFAERLGPIVADLMMHASQLANAVGSDLATCIRNRYRQNAARFAPDSEFAEL